MVPYPRARDCLSHGTKNVDHLSTHTHNMPCLRPCLVMADKRIGGVGQVNRAQKAYSLGGGSAEVEHCASQLLKQIPQWYGYFFTYVDDVLKCNFYLISIRTLELLQDIENALWMWASLRFVDEWKWLALIERNWQSWIGHHHIVLNIAYWGA